MQLSAESHPGVTNNTTRIYGWIVAAAILPAACGASAGDDATPDSAGWQKPAWLTDLSLGFQESYDNNVLGVSGRGMKPASSWISTVSPRLGIDFAPLLGDQAALQKLTLSYTPDFAVYHDAAAESYDAHKFGNAIQGKTGDFSFSVNNAFLYNDGGRDAPIYARNQLSGAAGNQNDKFRNFYAFAMPRERRDQIQDRSTAWLEYDADKLFFRPTGSWLSYDLNTIFHNAAKAPFLGYQNWPDRYDVNGGADVGYRVADDLALTLGGRYGSQYQQQFPAAISSDRHYSSSDYQRALLGLEGAPWKWLKVELKGGPDFREYNANAPVNNLHPVTYFGEAAITAATTDRQSLAFKYRQWEWVSSTGLVPYFDSTYALTYHWSPTRHWGLDLGGRMLEADFSSGSDTAGTAPSLRDDRLFTVSAGVSYSFNTHLGANLAYTYDLGRNAQDNLPAKDEAAYRAYDRQLVSLGVQYKF